MGCMRRELPAFNQIYSPQPSRRSVKGLSDADCPCDRCARVLFARLHTHHHTKTPNVHMRAPHIVVNLLFPLLTPPQKRGSKLRKARPKTSESRTKSPRPNHPSGVHLYPLSQLLARSPSRMRSLFPPRPLFALSTPFLCFTHSLLVQNPGRYLIFRPKGNTSLLLMGDSLREAADDDGIQT